MREKLLLARKRAGLTQQKLALLLKIPRYKYSKIESGDQKNVDVVLANSIAAVLGSTVDEIFLPNNSQKMRKKNGGAYNAEEPTNGNKPRKAGQGMKESWKEVMHSGKFRKADDCV